MAPTHQKGPDLKRYMVSKKINKLLLSNTCTLKIISHTYVLEKMIS